MVKKSGWKGEKFRHSAARRKILTAKGTEYEDAGGTYYEPDDVKLERRWRDMNNKANEYFMTGNFEKYLNLIKQAHAEQFSFYDIPDKERITSDKELLRIKALEYMDDSRIPKARFLYRYLVKLPTIKSTIQTMKGTGYYAGTEIENEFGRWNQSYNTSAGEWVIHEGKLHHIYLNYKNSAGVE